MHVQEEVRVPASAAQAWEFLWDIPRFAACLPGCKGVEEVEPGVRYRAQMSDHIGPYRIDAALDVQVQDARPLESIHILATGRDELLGTAQRVDLQVRLHEASPTETILDLSGEVEVLGKVAALGQFAIKRKVRDLTKTLAQNIAAAFQTAPSGAE